MKKITIKQGSRSWEELKNSRIGSSEVFDIVRYYAKDEELQNCGIDAKVLKEEKPFVTTWALYHKLIKDDIYQKGILPPELGEYGLAMEQFGLHDLKKNRYNKLKKGEVFISDRLIASLDISGIAEEIDVRQFDFGNGKVRVGQKFVCEQKTITPFKKNLPLKYMIQAQYQILQTKSDFFMLQLMILKEDTPFERGKIVALANASKKKFFDYVTNKIDIQYLYFANNEALAQLIKVCLERFFNDVDNRKEPKPFIEVDNLSTIMMSIRENSFYNAELSKEFDLTEYANAKKEFDLAEQKKKNAQQKIINFAMENNCSKFFSQNGYTASISSNGRLYVKEPKEVNYD